MVMVSFTVIVPVPAATVKSSDIATVLLNVAETLAAKVMSSIVVAPIALAKVTTPEVFVTFTKPSPAAAPTIAPVTV